MLSVISFMSWFICIVKMFKSASAAAGGAGAAVAGAGVAGAAVDVEEAGVLAWAPCWHAVRYEWYGRATLR